MQDAPQVITTATKQVKRRPRFDDIAGLKFGRLTVLTAVQHKGKAACQCKCDCGATCVATSNHLRTGFKQSCGCLKRETTGDRRRTHGQTDSPTHQTWRAMKARCEDSNNCHYANYGGRGITACARWSNSFEQFLADMGPRPSPQHTIDRMENDGNYEPANCRWATAVQQGNNKRSNRKLTYLGETLNCKEWAKRFGISNTTLFHRLERGWSIERALTQKPEGQTSAVKEIRLAHALKEAKAEAKS